MPRKPKATVDIMGNLEVMSRDTSLPEAVRAEAARAFVRLKAKEQPAPAPAPAPVVLEPDFSELIALEKEQKEAKAKAKEQELSESQQFAKEHRGPEPVEGETKPKPKPYVWRDQYGMSTDDYKRQNLRRQQEASAEWAFQMGLGTSHPEWPGV